MPPTAVLIPVDNSETTIDRLCHLPISDLNREFDLQIIQVEDGSGNHSPDDCRLHEQYPDIQNS